MRSEIERMDLESDKDKTDQTDPQVSAEPMEVAADAQIASENGK